MSRKEQSHTMSRREQRHTAALEYAMYPTSAYSERDCVAFEEGAKWADKHPNIYEQMLADDAKQYDNIDSAIKGHAEEYSFNIESELFPQLTKEQQAIWRKEIEQAVISGGQCEIELSKDKRYPENKPEVAGDTSFMAKKYKEASEKVKSMLS